jgi:DNA-binding XRE family transcriptional regulator
MLKIKELRKEKNQSQTSLAQIIGVSLRTIQNYEADNVDIPSKKLELIAQHFNVKVAYLFESIEEIKTFEDLKIDDKLNTLYKMLESSLNKIERNEKTINETSKSLLAYSSCLHEILNEVDNQSKDSKESI